MHENANKRTQSNKEKPGLISAHCVHALKHVSRVNVNEPIKKKNNGDSFRWPWETKTPNLSPVSDLQSPSF